MRKVRLLHLFIFFLLGACVVQNEPEQIFIPVEPENNQFYDGWELGIGFMIPDGWQGYGVLIDHDGGDGAYFEMGNSQTNLLTFDETFDPNQLPESFQHIVVGTDRLVNSSRVPTVMEAHVLEVSGPDESFAFIEINGRNVAHTQRSFNSAPSLTELVMTTVVDGRIVRFYGLAFDSQIESVREHLYSIIASLQPIDYSDWAQEVIPDYWGSIGHPLDWQMRVNSKSLLIGDATIHQIQDLTDITNDTTNPIVQFPYNLNREITEGLSEAILTAVSNHPSPLTPRERTPTGTLLHRPDIMIHQYMDNNSELVYFFGALENYHNPTHQRTMLITAVAPINQADAFAITFEQIIRSVGGPLMEWILVNPSDLPKQASDLSLTIDESETSTVEEPTSILEPTLVPTLPPATESLTPIEQQVQTVITLLNGNAFEGYPIADSFFSGVYGIRTWRTDDYTEHFPRQLATRYAGDTYGIRPLTIAADVDANLPMPWETAVSLNSTDYEVSHIIHSTGWGVDQPAEALLYFTKDQGAIQWIGAIFSFDQFAPSPTYDISPLTETIQTFLIDSQRQTAVLEELINPDTASYSSYSVNPNGTVALYTTGEHELAIPTYDLINLVTGQRTTFENQENFNMSASRAVWLDDRFVLVSFRDDPMDEGPVWGHLARLDTLTNELLIIEASILLGQPPVVTPSGAIIYNSDQGNAVIWDEGTKREVSMQTAIALGQSQWRYFSSLSMSNDQRYFIGITSIDDNALSRTKGIYVLLDSQTNEAQIVASFDAPPMGGYSAPAEWNSAGTHAVISPWANFAEQDGLTVVEASSGETYFMGLQSGNGRWFSDEVLIFDTYLNNEKQTHIFNLVTKERRQLDYDPNALFFPDGTKQPQNWTIAHAKNLGFSIEAPRHWQVEERGNDFYLGSTEIFGDGPHPIKYVVYASELQNQGNLPLATLYASQYDATREEDIAATHVETTINGYPAIRSDFIFSADGGLGYFVEDNGRYLQMSLFPYNGNEPYSGQEQYLHIFETMLATFELQQK